MNGSLDGVQGDLFKGCGCPLDTSEPAGSEAPTEPTGEKLPGLSGERKTWQQVAFLMGLPVKSAFALLLTRVTEPRTLLPKERRCKYEKNH